MMAQELMANGRSFHKFPTQGKSQFIHFVHRFDQIQINAFLLQTFNDFCVRVKRLNSNQILNSNFLNSLPRDKTFVIWIK